MSRSPGTPCSDTLVSRTLQLGIRNLLQNHQVIYDGEDLVGWGCANTVAERSGRPCAGESCLCANPGQTRRPCYHPWQEPYPHFILRPLEGHAKDILGLSSRQRLSQFRLALSDDTTNWLKKITRILPTRQRHMMWLEPQHSQSSGTCHCL